MARRWCSVAGWVTAVMVGACAGGGGGLDSKEGCPSGLVECGGLCIDTRYDPSNCGACATSCDAGDVCVQGTCGGDCSGGTTKCDVDGTPKCVSTDLDPAHCGGCGMACAPGELCSAGQCGGECTGGATECQDGMGNPICVNTAADSANCGECGKACPSDQVCSEGNCGLACVGGTTNCGDKCVDTLIDSKNCGGCGSECQNDDICTGGICAVHCGGGTTECGTICVDAMIDPNHCGGCDVQCNANEECAAGMCSPICMGGQTKCGGQCVDTLSSINHCGTCNNPCQPNETCANGMCTSALKDCLSILNANLSMGDGLYQIDPNGGSPNDAFMTFCDMTTDGGGWTLVLNRHTMSDSSGQPNLSPGQGTFDNTRATNWHFDVNLFYATATHFVFADKEGADCSGCAITGYDSAIRIVKPSGNAWSVSCANNVAVSVLKLVGPSANQQGTSYMCPSSLGWGVCSGNVCHYGVHSNNTISNGSWSQNQFNEMHFPTAYSSYKSYSSSGGYCRSCGGGLPAKVNNSSTCCSAPGNPAASRWTVWVR